MKIIFFLLGAALAMAQPVVRAPNDTTVAGLGSAASNRFRMYTVTDGATASDCTVGGGSTRVICYSSGVAWLNLSGASGGGGGSLTLQSNGTLVGTQPILNVLPGTGITWTPTDDGANNRVNVQPNADTSVLATRDQVVSNADTYGPTAGTSTAYTLSPVGAPLGAYATGQRFTVLFHAESGASPTINISTLGARKLYQQNGTTQIAATDIAANFVGEIVYDATLDSATGGFRVVNLGGGGSTPTAFKTAFALTGPMNSASGISATGANNRVNYYPFIVEHPMIVRRYKVHMNTGVGTTGIGIYTASCNIVAGTKATVTAPGSFTPAALTMAADVTLQPGQYYVGWTSTASSDGMYRMVGDFMPDNLNFGESGDTLRVFYGSNDSVSGVVPDSCGTRTATLSGSAPPSIYVYAN
jgi:hypothetical protein